MKRPTSLTIFIIFVIWSIFKGLESLLRPEASRAIYAEYGLEAVYFLMVFIAVVGGAVLLYTLIKRISWGAIFGQVWLGFAILHTAFIGYISATNIPLMEKIMLAHNQGRGRTAEEISEYLNSGIHEAAMIATAVIMIGAVLFFGWKLKQHKNYFLSNK